MILFYTFAMQNQFITMEQSTKVKHSALKIMARESSRNSFIPSLRDRLVLQHAPLLLTILKQTKCRTNQIKLNQSI